MSKIELQDFSESLPEHFFVSVVMEKRPSSHPWQDYSYRAVGVVSAPEQQDADIKLIHSEQGVERFLCSGLQIKLYLDQCESYYHNLMSPQPGCFIVATKPEDPDDMPDPYLVSLSFDEVHSYLEGDEEIYAVEIPAELYKWSEAYVLTHYLSEKKKKRKLTDWRKQAPELVLHSDSEMV